MNTLRFLLTTKLDVLVGIIVLYLIALIFTVRVDRRRARYEQMNMPYSTSSIALATVSSDSPTQSQDGSAPGTPQTPRTSLSYSPSSPRASTRMIDVDESGNITDLKTGRKLGFLRLASARLKMRHSWVAVLFSPNNYEFTRTNLLTLLLIMVLSNLLISAVFYQNNADEGAGQRVINGLIVGCIVLPITLTLSFIFRKMPKRFWYISYIIAVAYCLVCVILTLVYALDFGDKKTKAWLISMAVSTGQDGIISQPIKLIISSLLIILFPTAWFSSVLL